MTIMARIGIIGLGNWGTTLAHIWCRDGHNVLGWTIENDVYESLMITNENKKYLPDFIIPELEVTMEISDITKECEILVLALPSNVILEVFDELIHHIRPSHLIIDLAKGLANRQGNMMISNVIEERLRENGKSNSVVVMTGPTIAPEVARGVLTTALVACHDRSVAERVSGRLSTDSLILKPTEDPVGAELWGAYKNTVALACGIVDGLRDTIGGDNLKAALVVSGYSEGIILLEKMGANPNTAFGPAGIGDLYVTATSPRSRNRTLGQMLGEGKGLEQALEEMHMVAEGVRATRMFSKKSLELGHHSPFLLALDSLLAGKVGAEKAVRMMVESYSDIGGK